MSQGAVKARKERDRRTRACERADAEFRRIEANAATDATLVRCVICRHEQIDSGTAYSEETYDASVPCFRCGSTVAVFVEYLPGHGWYAQGRRVAQSGSAPGS